MLPSGQQALVVVEKGKTSFRCRLCHCDGFKKSCILLAMRQKIYRIGARKKLAIPLPRKSRMMLSILALVLIIILKIKKVW